MKGLQTTRRRFLQSALTAGTFTLGSNLWLPQLRAQRKTQRQFMPVKVSRERLIRTVVGLRPYRSQGFVLRSDRLGEKTVIHNYGHGGAGVTLSWGVARLALEQTRDIEYRDAAVLGCGVIGLSTARLLQRRGKTVTIYARDLPPETTSNASGALWFPTSLHNPLQVGQPYMDQFRLACRLSQRAFQDLVGNEYGVRWIETFDLQEEVPVGPREIPGGAELYPGTQIHKDARRYYGFPYVTQFSTLLIEPPVYLNALLRDYYTAGGKVSVRELRSREEIRSLPEPVIFNCTGLGARMLFDDLELIPVRGQLEVLLPQSEIDYCYLSDLGYMFPRRDGIILGGTFDRENWSLSADPDQTRSMLEAHAEVMSGLRR